MKKLCISLACALGLALVVSWFAIDWTAHLHCGSLLHERPLRSARYREGDFPVRSWKNFEK